MADADDQAVLKALTAKGAFSPCQRCKRTDFGLIGYSPMPVNPEPHSWELGGMGARTAMIMCRLCGCLNLHALEPLGVAVAG